MPAVAFKDLANDLLHISPVRTSPYTDTRAKYDGTYCLEIEMVSGTVAPALYFTADQLRALAGVLTIAAEQLEKKGN
jgi:hypothetical protein